MVSVVYMFQNKAGCFGCWVTYYIQQTYYVGMVFQVFQHFYFSFDLFLTHWIKNFDNHLLLTLFFEVDSFEYFWIFATTYFA